MLFQLQDGGWESPGRRSATELDPERRGNLAATDPSLASSGLSGVVGACVLCRPWHHGQMNSWGPYAAGGAQTPYGMMGGAGMSPYGSPAEPLVK